MTDEKISRLRDLFLTQSDVAGWVVLLYAMAMIGFERVEVWPGGIGLVFLGLAAIVGSSFAKGISLGPISGPKGDDDGE